MAPRTSHRRAVQPPSPSRSPLRHLRPPLCLSLPPQRLANGVAYVEADAGQRRAARCRELEGLCLDLEAEVARREVEVFADVGAWSAIGGVMAGRCRGTYIL